jgi:hypothetical protein
VLCVGVGWLLAAAAASGVGLVLTPERVKSLRFLSANSAENGLRAIKSLAASPQNTKTRPMTSKTGSASNWSFHEGVVFCSVFLLPSCHTMGREGAFLFPSWAATRIFGPIRNQTALDKTNKAELKRYNGITKTIQPPTCMGRCCFFSSLILT